MGALMRVWSMRSTHLPASITGHPRWVEMRSRCSHRHFKHPDQAFVITEPGNDGKELTPGTLNATLKKAGLK
jgi:predicted RNA binding protein YcfA (HicA-like mRNA interferase family)